MQSRNRIYLSLGSNLGDRIGYLTRAVDHLRETGKIVAVSTVYESQPWGYKDQPEFLNCVVSLETDLRPEELLDEVKSIEKRIGRVHRFRWGPREIDIDILLYGNLIVRTNRLEIPHPRMKERDFVLVPLLDLEQDLRDPVTGKPYREFLKLVEVKLKPFCCILV